MNGLNNNQATGLIKCEISPLRRAFNLVLRFGTGAIFVALLVAHQGGTERPLPPRQQDNQPSQPVVLAMTDSQKPAQDEIDIVGQTEPDGPPLHVRLEPDVIGHALTTSFIGLIDAHVGERFSVPLPNGYQVMYTVSSIRHQSVLSHITLVGDQDGFVSTITIRDHTVYGTLASRWGSFSVEESGGRGHFVDHASLNMRMNYHEEDFHVPRHDSANAS